MQYVNYEQDIVQRYRVVLEGWTYDKLVNPSELSTAVEPLRHLLNAIKNGSCKFVKLSSEERKRRAAEYEAKLASGEVTGKQRKTRKDAGVKRKRQVATDEEDDEEDDEDEEDEEDAGGDEQEQEREEDEQAAPPLRKKARTRRTGNMENAENEPTVEEEEDAQAAPPPQKKSRTRRSGNEENEPPVPASRKAATRKAAPSTRKAAPPPTKRSAPRKATATSCQASRDDETTRAAKRKLKGRSAVKSSPVVNDSGDERDGGVASAPVAGDANLTNNNSGDAPTASPETVSTGVMNVSMGIASAANV